MKNKRVRQGQSYWLAYCEYEDHGRHDGGIKIVSESVNQVFIESVRKGQVTYSCVNGVFIDPAWSFMRVAKKTKRAALLRLPLLRARVIHRFMHPTYLGARNVN